MSEPMSSVEIEDVLSSIRRLVSEDLRPNAPVRGPKLAAESDGGAEKLILTPAHRIAELEPVAMPAAFHSVRADAADAAAAIDVVVQSLARAAEGEGDDVADISPAAEPRWQERSWSRHSHDPAVGDEAGFAHVEDTVEPAPVARMAPMPPAAVVDDVPEPAVMPEPELVDYAPRYAHEDDDEDDEPELGQSDPAPAVENRHDWRQQANPAPRADETPRDPKWADAAEAAARKELDEQLDATVFADVSGQAIPATMDEEALRDLVRDIIREELQGALGERITRNVRKLVRSEIARALAVRDFE